MKKTKTIWVIIFLFSLGFSQVQKDPFNQMGDAFDELEGKLSLYFFNALNITLILFFEDNFFTISINISGITSSRPNVKAEATR